MLDFACGVVSVVLAVAMVQGSGLASWRLGAATGLLIVAADALGGHYRDLWRYTSIHEAIEILVSSMLAPTVLAVARALDLLEMPMATVVLMGLLIGAARVRTGSIYVPIAMHSAASLVAMIEAALVG